LCGARKAFPCSHAHAQSPRWSLLLIDGWFEKKVYSAMSLLRPISAALQFSRRHSRAARQSRTSFTVRSLRPSVRPKLTLRIPAVSLTLLCAAKARPLFASCCVPWKPRVAMRILGLAFREDGRFRHIAQGKKEVIGHPFLRRNLTTTS
jgi:hypothetical protein